MNFPCLKLVTIIDSRKKTVIAVCPDNHEDIQSVELQGMVERAFVLSEFDRNLKFETKIGVFFYTKSSNHYVYISLVEAEYPEKLAFQLIDEIKSHQIYQFLNEEGLVDGEGLEILKELCERYYNMDTVCRVDKNERENLYYDDAGSQDINKEIKSNKESEFKPTFNPQIQAQKPKNEEKIELRLESEGPTKKEILNEKSKEDIEEEKNKKIKIAVGILLIIIIIIVVVVVVVVKSQ